MQDQVLAIPTKDVDEAMRLLIPTGKYERFAQSDDVLVGKNSGDYVYLVTFEAYETLMREIQENETREKRIGVVAVRTNVDHVASRVMNDRKTLGDCFSSCSAQILGSSASSSMFLPSRSLRPPNL